MPDRAQRLRDEHARSHGYLKQYHAKNPSVLSDPENYLQAFGMCTDEQLKDLRAAGVPLSANPTATEIHQAHLEARAHAPHRVRSADKLIEHVHGELEKRRRPRESDGTFAPIRDD